MEREEFQRLLESYHQGKTKRVELFFDNLQLTNLSPLLTDKKQKQLFSAIEKQLPDLKNGQKRRHFRSAAVTSVALCLSLMVWFFSTSLPHEILTFSTTTGQETLQLSDGSVVYLNQHTTIAYPKHFDKTSRKMELLKGSAFFEVAKDENRPFSVISGDVITKVLGTTFNIVKRDSAFSVTVASGKVKVSSKNNSVNLVANEQALFSNSGILKKQQVNAQLYSHWMVEKMDYGNILLSELSTVMQLRFGLPFHFLDDSLKDRKVRVTISEGETLNEVISKLNYITNYNLKIHADVITISKSN